MRSILVQLIKNINPFDDFDEKTDLIGDGILDSLTLMTFVEQIEKKLNVNIPEEVIIIDNFYNIKTIEELITNLKRE